MTEDKYESAVAIIGMAGRFPGAADVDTLWRNLLAGVPGLRDITEEELTEAGVQYAQRTDPHYVRVGAPVDGLSRFDASLFGLNPREAETMDPQHRLLLECSWEALEGAGYPPTDPADSVGVFAGCGFPDYMLKNVGHLMSEPGGSLLLAVGNERDSLASFISYKLGLRGPSLTVQTFCSSALVSAHLAVQSLLTYECDLALAGGAFLPLPQPAGYLYEPGGILSPDGRVRSFDAAADGTVMGSAAGVVALKRMTDALADGDVIHAVILGSAVNNDGRERAGYTAPGVDGQAQVIEAALAVANVKSDTIGYVECHATGTQLGDSIELAAMNRAFHTVPERPCVLGSLKPSLGHLDRAAGVAGLIRATLSVREGVLPATPGFETPNPTLAAAEDRFTVLREHQPWPAGAAPRRAGVSSFGLGGTNAHMVLEQAPPRTLRPLSAGPHLLAFSAASPEALDELTQRLRRHVAEHPEEDLADVAFTLQVSRGRLAMRRAVVCRDRADAIAALADPSRWIDGVAQQRNPQVTLVAQGDAGEPWWAELTAAAHRLLAAGDEDAVEVPPTPEGAVAAVVDGLTRLGVRVTEAGTDAAAEEIVVTPGEGTAAEWILTTLARLWKAGAVVDWAALHRGEGRRVELPTYPFQRRHYWVKPEPAPQESAQAAGGRVDDPAHWTYRPVWRQRALPDDDLASRLRAAGPWMVFVDDPRGEAVVERLGLAGAEVVAVRPGEAFGQDEGGDYVVRPGHAEDIAEVLASQLVSPRTVVHGLSLAAGTGQGYAHFEAEQERGFHSALALVRALVEVPYPAPTELVLLTSGAVGVVGADLRHPEHAALAALAPSLAQENPLLSCRHIDLDDGDSALGIDHVLNAAVRTHQGPVAVRGAELWERDYEPQELSTPDADRPSFRPGESVLITGGLGDVGLTLARHLTRMYGCRLVLTGRTELPPRERWQTYLASAPEGDRAARHIRSLLELEDQGATVLALCADVADEARMRAVVRTAVDTFGGIDVVVHGAGAQDPRFFDMSHLSDRTVCDAHFRAKVHGFHVLQSVLGDQAADRRITLSSIATVLGGITFGPYAAANAALDAYARSARLGSAGKWLTVNWDTWGADRGQSAGAGQVRSYEMAPAEAIQVFERALASARWNAQVVVSTGPIEPRVRQWVTEGGPSDTEVLDDGERHPRPPLATPYTEPVTDTEKSIADIWAATLRLEEVGVDDDFFQLGGHSLIAIQVATRMSTSLSVPLPVTALLAYPTVRQLATLIDGGATPPME